MKKLQNTLYVFTQDSYLFVQNEAIVIKVGGEEKVRIPSHTIDTIFCFGNTTVSTPLIAFCGERGIGLAFFSDYGRFYGRIAGPVHGNILLRRRQFAGLDDPFFSTRLVRSFLLGKLLNAKELLARSRREQENPTRKDALAQAEGRLTELSLQMPDCLTIDSLRGLEGAAAASYFGVFDQMLKSGDAAMHFSGRNRRPPEDPVNALLSFLYTLLKNDVQSALEGVGLDPAAGFLHTLRPGRPALALDLMEELRAPLCDRLALALINRGQITSESFESLTAPVLLTEKARKAVVTAWQARKQETITHPFLQEKLPIGLIAFSQAQLLARVIRGDLDEYPPFHWR
ncbi:MAG: type I-C CRISPR-associated endonuclease Cas1c [Oscillospiraceae bacterium]